jgi:hypothetical protein
LLVAVVAATMVVPLETKKVEAVEEQVLFVLLQQPLVQVHSLL